MRMNYKTYPVDYINELRAAGKRKKAMAFMDYWHDLEMGEFNSYGFYANAWNVSKSTAHIWIQEFKNEIDLFLNHWQLRNEQHFKNVKNSSQDSIVKKRAERNERSLSNETNALEIPNYRDFENSNRTNLKNEPNEVFNIYDDDKYIGGDKFFDDLFFIYRLNTKFAGKKSEAYKAYLSIKDKVDYLQLKRAIMLYLHDPSIDKRYNFKNFLENEVFYSYIPKRIKIKIKDEWKIGTYDDKEQVFVSDDGYRGILTPERLAELFAKGELGFIR